MKNGIFSIFEYDNAVNFISKRTLQSLMLEVMLLAIALSMDVLAVSIGIGVTESARFSNSKHPKRFLIVIVIALYFASFHAGGVTLFSWFEHLSQWIGFSILLFLGLKAIYDSFQETVDNITPSLTHIALIILAFATSIDAFATGFTLALLSVSPLLACFVIGLTTFAFSLFGLYLGSTSSERLALKAELVGGIILIVIAFKILF